MDAEAATESVPIIDLSLLTQSDINSLAFNSPSAFNLDTLSDVVPVIDRSVFNESAGSRKQTYSRLPLSHSQSQSQSHSHSLPQNPNPNPSPNPSLPRRRGRPRLHPLPITNPSPADPPDLDLGRQENLKIVSILRKLIESRGKKEDGERERERELRNAKGEELDLVALREKEDIFGEEIRRRTDGLRTEEQILGYMTGLDGQWGSRRKRRKLVDAALFGDGLPKGWRLLLAMKRKDGIVYLNCRRYVRLASYHNYLFSFSIIFVVAAAAVVNLPLYYSYDERKLALV